MEINVKFVKDVPIDKVKTLTLSDMGLHMMLLFSVETDLANGLH